MNDPTLPDPWTGDEALLVVAFLERVIADVWAQHGAAMKLAGRRQQWLVDSFRRDPADPRQYLEPEDIDF